MIQQESLGIDVIVHRFIVPILPLDHAERDPQLLSRRGRNPSAFSLRPLLRFQKAVFQQPVGEVLGAGPLHLGIPGGIADPFRKLDHADGLRRQLHPGQLLRRNEKGLGSGQTAVCDHLLQHPGHIGKAPAQPYLIQSRILRQGLIRNRVNSLRQLVQIHFCPLHGFQFCHGNTPFVFYFAIYLGVFQAFKNSVLPYFIQPVILF